MKGKIIFAFLMVAVMVFVLPASGIAPQSAAAISTAASVAVKEGGTVDILISTSSNNYSKIVSQVEKLGGTVTQEFKYAKGLAATVPASAVSSLSVVNGVEGISLDALRSLPDGGANPQALPATGLAGKQDLDALSQAGAAFSLDGYEFVSMNTSALNVAPDTYYNPFSMNAGPVWATGNFGQGSLVVVIDTGIYADHFMFGPGQVVGGVDLSSDVGTSFEGYNRVDNHYHGTHVSGIVGGLGGILVPNDDLLAMSYEYYSGVTLPQYDPDNKLIILSGMAPDAQLYGVKVFPHTGAGAPTSTIIAGIEHAIDLHVNGVYDVDAINMSLGGANLFDGRDLEDQVVDYATSVGITMVVAAGNDGPSSMNISSPGTANTAISTGAVAHPVNTRIYWDQVYGFGAGDLLYVDDNPQIIYFSNRGPTADGRSKPTASAVGVYVLSALTGGPGALGWASGTSMATPAMAGVVALLNSYGETVGASPYDYKEAVIAGSHLLPGYEDFEQGAGFIDAADAMTALMADGEFGSVQPSLRNGFSRKSVKPAGMQLEDINESGGETFVIEDLAPGYVEHFYFNLHPNAEKIIVEFSDVDLGVDPILFNSFEVHLTSAIRTSDLSYYFATTNVWDDAVLEVESLNSTASGAVFGVNAFNLPLMPGNVRLTIENDWTSFDNLSGTVTVTVIHDNNSEKADESYSGSVNTGDSFGFIPVGFGSNGVEIELGWKNDWSRYPTSDLDLIVAWFDTDGNLSYVFDGATLNSPEIVRIDAKNIDAVFVLVDGYETNGIDEPWTLDVTYK